MLDRRMRNAWEWEELNSHVAGLWIAVHNAENGIGAVVMRVALDRGARRCLGIVLL
jgi:hypothetical protein